MASAKTTAPAWHELELPASLTAGIVEVEVAGLSAILMDNPSRMSAPAATTSRAGSRLAPAEEAELAAYRTPAGTLYMPAAAFMGAALKAAMSLRYAAHPATKRGSARFLASAVRPMHEIVELVDDAGRPLSKFEVDARRVNVGGRQSSSVVKGRALVPLPWRALLRFSFDVETMGAANGSPGMLVVLRDGLVEAGKGVGIGNYRPQLTGSYGRFEVVAFRWS